MIAATTDGAREEPQATEQTTKQATTQTTPISMRGARSATSTIDATSTTLATSPPSTTPPRA